MRFEARVGFEDFVADAPLDGGLDFGFGAGDEVFLEHLGGLDGTVGSVNATQLVRRKVRK